MHFRPMPAESLGLITNYRCTFRCRHCLYCSSPDVSDDLQESGIFQIVDGIDRVLGPVPLHIGGGEPLLHFDFILALLSRLNAGSAEVEYLETNGAPLLKRTETKLGRLKSSGLKRLLLSISPFHCEFIPVGRTMDILRSIVRVLGPEGIFPWHPGYLPFLESISGQKTIQIEDYFGRLSPQDIRHQLTGIMYIHPGGRAAGFMSRYLPCYPAESLLNIDCARHLASPVHAHVDYRGNYLTGFCGGLRVGRQAALDLGGLYKKGIPLSRYPLLDMLVTGGLRELYGWACEKDFKPAERGYVSPCHLCLDIRLHLYASGESFEEMYPSFFYEELNREKEGRECEMNP